MERFAFIHGSSVGQSAFIPADSPASVCNDIANKYFQGRTPRQKESAAKQSLFVELYKSPKGDNYSVYSFVNNNCRGANGRDGQYLALTIICKNVYVFPELIFRMLSSAYNQMFATGKIIGGNKGSEQQYIISQFSDENEYLSIFLKKIEEAFDNVANGLCKTIDSSNHIANYDTWYGKKVNIDSCNSMATFKSFCDIGRLYISEEYESSEEKIKGLETYIKKLEKEKADLEHLSLETKRLEKSKVRDELEELNSQIKEKDKVIDSLTVENNNYRSTIETVRGELEKYAKLGKSITDIQNKKPQYQSKSKKDIIKIGLLLIILILLILSSLMNYTFFRDISPFHEENQEMSENIETTPDPSQTPAKDDQETSVSTSLDITPQDIKSKAKGGTYDINITTSGEWETPTSPENCNWVKITRENNKLSIKIEENTSPDLRKCTIMIKVGNLEKQISINQEGKSVGSTQVNKVNYGVVVKNDKGIALEDGALVKNGQKLSVEVTTYKSEEGFGWKYYNCLGNKTNVKTVTVEVKVTEKDNDIIISYGDLSKNGYREKRKFKLDTETDRSSSNNSTSTKETGNSK